MQSECLHSEVSPFGRIEVWQENSRRSLWFDDVILQTEIVLEEPAVLPNPANRAMLAHLMFDQRPQRVLLAGCGGGAIARWFHFWDSGVKGEAIEISSAVARVAYAYFEFPEPGTGWRIKTTDIRAFITQGAPRYDFILVDLEENQKTPAWVTSPEFLSTCARQLTPAGVLAVNLITDGKTAVTQAIWNLRRGFDRRVLCLPVPSHDNLILIAFNETPEVNALAEQAANAEKRWGLEFMTFLERLKSNNPVGSGIF